MINLIRDELKSAEREAKYKKFQERLACSNYPLEGIRTAVMRECAKKIAKQIEINQVIGVKPVTFEELSVIGLIIAYHPCSIENKFAAIDYFISINDNWAASDTVITTLKNKSENYFNYLINMVNDGGWRARYAITSLLWNFLDKEHLDTIFERLYKINYGEHYVDTAVSWFLSKAYPKFKNEVEEFFESAPLNKFVLKTTVFKIKDIAGLSKQEKERMEDILKDVLCKREMF